jgi:hypothetical protein
MLFGQDRDQLRAVYCQAWQEHCEGKPLQPLQAQIVSVIEQHREYQSLLEHPERALSRDYLPESGQSNPFLHMGMHLAIQEQISTDRPPGIRDLYRKLLAEYLDAHQLQHQLMQCLAEMLWRAQRDGTVPDEARYLSCIRALARQR